MSHFLQNLNGNVLCSIDCETTGFDPNLHDIIQFACIPLDSDLKPRQDKMPFDMHIKPERLETIDSEALRINRLDLAKIAASGFDKYQAADLFVEWFEGLQLGIHKKIMPLGCNYSFDRDMMIEWLGKKTYDYCFMSTIRDVQSLATFCNDLAGYKGQDFPYPKVNLAYLCSQTKTEHAKLHDALEDARATAVVYGKILRAML